jgi:hypothetical protein
MSADLLEGLRSSLDWMRMERRRSGRIELCHRDAFVRGSRLGTSHVSDLSADGLGLVLPAEQAKDLCSERIELFLGGYASLRATAQLVRHQLLGLGQVRVGLSLSDLDSDGLSLLQSFLLEEAAEQDEAFERYWGAEDAVRSGQPDHVTRILRLSAEPSAPPLLVFEGRSKLETRLRVISVEEDGFSAVLERGPGLKLGRRYGLVAPGRGAVSAFRAGLRAVEGQGLRFSFPTELVQSGFRTSARSLVPADVRCSIRFRHPRSAGFMTKAVLDASQVGVSIGFDRTLDLLFPGDQLSEVELCFAGKHARVQGIVRSIQEGADLGSCGVEFFDFGSAAQREAWSEFVFRLSHPRLDVSPATAPTLGFQVLESSGYVELWSNAEDRALSRAEYAEFWGQPAPSGRVVTLLESGQPVATIAANLLYPRTFMIHHFGVDVRARSDRTAFLSYTRELYSGVLHALSRFDDFEYLAMYMEADKAFNEFLYGEFARIVADPSVLAWTKNQVYRADTRASIPEGPMDRLVRVAADADLGLLADTYARGLSAMQIAALELSAEGLSGAGFARRLGHQHALRSRQTYVFAPGGRALWALVCETGDEGANLFGLLNRCWLTELVPLGSQERLAARRTLLRRALRHFAGAGKRGVLLLEPEGESTSDALAAGFMRVSDGVCWLSRRDVMPAWLAYIDDALSLTRARLRRAA